jgi:hypothetical protein
MRQTIIALLLLLSGAAVAVAQSAPTNPGQPKQAVKPTATRQPPQQTGPCTIGVVSELGEKFAVRKIGYTVFGNEDSEVPVESWHVDDLVIAKINGALGKRAVARRIPFHKEAFASLETFKLFRDSEGEVGEGVRRLTAGTRCARYLLITRAYRMLGTSNQSIGGIGILYDRGPFGRVHVYALFSLRLYDGETFALLKQAAAPSGGVDFLEGIHGPHRQVDSSLWPESPNNAAQDARLREAIRELVAQGMDAALTQLPLAE